MRKQRFCLILIVLILFKGACADGIEIKTDDCFGHAAEKVIEWYIIVQDYVETIEDDESRYFLEQAMSLLQLNNYFLINADDSSLYILEDMGDILYSEGNATESDDYSSCSTPYLHIDEMVVQTDALWKNNYISIISSYYDVEGNYSATERIDIARRDNELMVYINSYDNEFMWTSRYAVLCENKKEGKLIYTRTFGMINNVQLDINEWLNGKDFIIWDSSLLYAPSVQDQ